MSRDPFEAPDDYWPSADPYTVEDDGDWRNSDSPVVRDLLRIFEDDDAPLEPCTRPNCRGCGCGMPLAKPEPDEGNEPPF